MSFSEEQKNLDELVYQLQNILISHLNMAELLATVETSAYWTTSHNTKAISLHVMFPYAQVDVNFQRTYLRSAILKIFTKVSPIEPMEHIIQPIKDYVLMYRCTESELEEPMIMSHVYQRLTSENNAINLLTSKDMSSVFIPHYYHNGILSKDWLFMFVSIYYWTGTTSIKDSLDEDITTTKNPLTLTIQLLDMLHVNRFNIEPFWKDIGQSLFNITDGSQEGLTLFKQHSTQATVPHRDPIACRTYYTHLTRNQLSEKTIAFYARHDSRKKYDEWHGSWTKPLIYKALSCDVDDVAELIYRIFWLEHLCTHKDRNIWYVFKNHRLMIQDDCVDLELGISEYLVPMLEKMKDAFREENMFRNQIDKLCKHLKNPGFITSCIRMARKKFYVYDFDKYKDCDPFKTGWSNCMITCSSDHAYTSDGKPEDYITKSTYMTYRSEFTWQHPLVAKFLTFMGQVFPDKELCHFSLKNMASFLHQERQSQVWCGTDESKTMIAKLLQLVLGAYCVDFPPCMLTGRYAHPELVQAHIGFVTHGDEKIVKHFTHEDQFSFNKGGCKIIIMCKCIPEITLVNKALRDKFLYLPFLSQWTDSAPDDPIEQYRQRKFKKNLLLEDELGTLAHAAAWVMVQYYSIYKKEGLNAPPIIVQYTEDYWTKHDPIIAFITEYITPAWTTENVIDMNKSFTVSEAHIQFIKWHRKIYPEVQVPSQPSFKQDLWARLGPQSKGKRWYGMDLKTSL